MKLEIILSQNFAKAFGKLLDGETINLHPKIISRMKRLHAKLRDEKRIFDEMREGWAKELADKDENGKPIIENNMYKISNENMLILDEKVNEALKIEIDIGEKIEFKEIQKVNLSVKDLIILEDLISDPKD